MSIYHETEIAMPRVSAAGYFEIIGRKSDGSGRQRIIAPRQRNLILDTGLERLGVGNPVTHCHLGTGITPPTTSDTALEGWIASAGSPVVSTGGTLTPPYYSYRTLVFTFQPAASAYVASEIGAGWSATNDSMWARALVKDAWGVPINAAIEVGEVVVVKYEYHHHPWVVDTPFEILVFGQVYDGFMRPAIVTSYWDAPATAITMRHSGNNVLAYPGVPGAVTSYPAGSAAAASLNTEPPYTSGSRKRIGTYQWNLNSANYIEGIKGMRVPCYSMWYQIGFTIRGGTDGLRKNDQNSLILNLTSPVWGRKP